MKQFYHNLLHNLNAEKKKKINLSFNVFMSKTAVLEYLIAKREYFSITYVIYGHSTHHMNVQIFVEFIVMFGSLIFFEIACKSQVVKDWWKKKSTFPRRSVEIHLTVVHCSKNDL